MNEESVTVHNGQLANTYIWGAYVFMKHESYHEMFMLIRCNSRMSYEEDGGTNTVKCLRISFATILKDGSVGLADWDTCDQRIQLTLMDQYGETVSKIKRPAYTEEMHQMLDKMPKNSIIRGSIGDESYIINTVHAFTVHRLKPSMIPVVYALSSQQRFEKGKEIIPVTLESWSVATTIDLFFLSGSQHTIPWVDSENSRAMANDLVGEL